MTVKKEASGRRSTQSEIEVPGTPEQVWDAIATSQGLSSWFVPSEIDCRVGGSILCNMGPGMDAIAKVTEWEPPHRLTAEGDWGGGAPPVATEWTVEALSGGTCIVRVVHSLFASTDDWDDQLEGTETGWPGFFAVLHLYLSHFSGQACSSFRVQGVGTGSVGELWAEFGVALGLSGRVAGQRTAAGAAGTPAFAGTIEEVDPAGPGRALVRLDDPAGGIASIGAYPMGEQVLLGIGFFFYGEDAATAAAESEAAWQGWMSDRYPLGT